MTKLTINHAHRQARVTKPIPGFGVLPIYRKAHVAWGPNGGRHDNTDHEAEYSEALNKEQNEAMMAQDEGRRLIVLRDVEAGHMIGIYRVANVVIDGAETMFDIVERLPVKV